MTYTMKFWFEFGGFTDVHEFHFPDLDAAETAGMKIGCALT